MKSYVLATQQPWGVNVFKRVRTGRSVWFLVQSSKDLRYELDKWPPLRYVFFLNWSDIVRPDVLAMSECVNFHSFGPQTQPMVWHRGGGPLENLILRGYTETMIGAHRMVSEVDAGPIYAMRGPVSLAGTKAEILDRFIVPCVSLIREIVETEPEPYPQVGKVVRFSRLPNAEYEQLWEGRR